MRIHFENLTRPKLVAKSLRKALKGVGHELSLARCLEAVAAMYGYRDWHELTKGHAAMPASPDDGDCPEDVVAARRVQYGTILEGLGVGPGHVGRLLDAVRPSDRSSGATVVIRRSLPRFLIEAYETDDAGNDVRSLGMQDLTEAVVHAMVSPYGTGRIRELEDAPLVHALQSGLTEDARRAGYHGRLALTSFREGLEAFIAEVGGRAALPAFRKRLEDISWTKVLVSEAEKELAAARSACFTADATGQVMFHVPHDNREYVDSIEQAYDGWGWDTYNRISRMPDWDDPDRREAWNAEFAAWQSTKAPPFVFGTSPVPWKGVDAAEIRERHREHEDVDLDGMIESSLEEHHEDAYDHVVALDEIYGICEAWLEHAGTGSAEDRALEGKVAAWNARQRIVTYYADFNTILPTRKGGTHADAIAWCERRLAEKRSRLDELSRWQVPEEAPARETDAPAL